MFYWGRGFGTDLTDKVETQNFRNLCYCNSTDNNDNSVPLIVSKNVFLCCQIPCFGKEDSYAVEKINENSELNYQVVDFLSQEREFVKGIDFLVDILFASIETMNYSQIVNRLKEPLNNVKNMHLMLISKIEEILKKNDVNNIIDSFIKELVNTSQLLNTHNNYMNKYFSIEKLIIDLSIERTSQFQKELRGKVILSLFRSPVHWQNHILDVIDSLKKVMPVQIYQSYNNVLQEFTEKIIDLSATIDSIPKLEQISKMFFSEPFPIVSPSRRFIKEGFCLKKCRSKISKRQVILFSDYFLYTQIKGNIFFSPAYFELKYLEVKPYPDEEHDRSLVIYSPKKSFVIDFETKKERDEWLQEIKTAAFNAKENADGPLEQKRMAPVWYSDNETNSCMICQANFTVFNRRHHCRGCGYVVCKNCVPNRIVIPGIEDNKPVPVCDSCMVDLVKLKR